MLWWIGDIGSDDFSGFLFDLFGRREIYYFLILFFFNHLTWQKNFLF